MTEHHEPIISPDDFDKVQIIIKQRAKDMKIKSGETKYLNRYPFSGKII